MWPFIISLIGLLGGIFLAWLVPEELEAGKKYFRWAQQGIFAVLIAVSFYFLRSLFWQKNFLSENFLLMLSLFFVSAVFFLAFFVKISLFKFFSFLFPYLFFGYLYFLSTSLGNLASFQLTLASLLFLYGFPTGTLLFDEVRKN